MSSEYLPKDISLQQALFWGSCTHHFQQIFQGDLQSRVVHVIMTVLELPPIIGQIVSLVELLFFRCMAQATPVDIMQDFWQKHIRSFEIRHGTNSLYLNHFKQHGISSNYPVALEELIEKTRNLWQKHRYDIAPKTEYFCHFEQRYDQARSAKEIGVSFSASGRVIDEFTLGARHGGEWIREIRHFVLEAQNNIHVLSSEERKILLELRSFIQVLESLPPLIVTIRPGLPALAASRNKLTFSTLEGFIERVKHNCEDWQDTEQLSDYLEHKLLPVLEREQEEYRGQYEIPVDFPIQPKDMEFRLVRNAHKPISMDFPHLEFDKPVVLSKDELLKLQIERNGFSSWEEYQDSRFVCEYDYQSGRSTVIRKKMTEEDKPDLALRNEAREMRKAWLKAFNCDLIPLECI